MMKKQKGASLVVALILLTIITLVAAYSIEGTTIQSKMIASSLFSTLTYQECRNEQAANVRFYNDNGGANRVALLDLIGAVELDEDGNPVENDDGENIPATIRAGGNTGVNPMTKVDDDPYSAQSDIAFTWSFIKEEPAARGGYTIDTESPTKAYLFQNDCIAVLRFSKNDQTLGAIVEGLVQAGDI